MTQINTLLDLSRKMRSFDIADKDKFLQKLDTCPKNNFEKHRRLLEISYNLENFFTSKSKNKPEYIENPKIKDIQAIISIIKLLYAYTGLDSQIKKAFRESVHISPDWSIQKLMRNNQRN